MQESVNIKYSDIIKTIENSSLHWIGDFASAISEFEHYLDSFPLELKLKKRTLFLFTELVQNVTKHSTDKISSHVWITYTENEIKIHSINQIKPDDENKLLNENKSLANYTKDELRQVIKQRIIEGKKGTGLPEIHRKSKAFKQQIIKTNDKNYLYSKITCHAKIKI